MKLVLDALWRALAYCWMPRVIWLSLLPLVLCALLAGVAGHLYWEAAVAGVHGFLSQWSLVQTLYGWLEGVGLNGLRSVLAPLVVVALATPVVIVVSLLAVAAWLTPAVAEIVRRRRFPDLARRADEPWIWAVLRSVGLTLLALLALLLSLPLWLIPPLAAILPPLVWGWLTFRVMTPDVLSAAASRAESRRLMREHRVPLLLLGVVSGYLGAVPTLIWVFGAMTLVFAPLLIVASVWLYTMIFAFSSLWFAHYALAALHRMRSEAIDAALPGPPGSAVPPSLEGPVVATRT